MEESFPSTLPLITNRTPRRKKNVSLPVEGVFSLSSTMMALMDRSESGWAIWMFPGWPCQGMLLVGRLSRIGAWNYFLYSFSIFYRSLGDVVAHSAGVISDPEFTEFELDAKADKFLVVATDGLWEFVTNQETTEMVEGQIGPAQAVDTLVTEAGTRWMQEEQVIDDTTVIVANLFGWKSSS
jgi:hypothetical protein